MKAVDLFAGAGGLTVGLKRAGFDVVAAVEVEAHAVATYKANHPEVSVFRQDVRTVTGLDLLQCAGPDGVTLLACCPPCQGFSSLTAKYTKTDPRNALVYEVGRLVEELSPSMVMMENVPRLADAEVFQELLGKLSELGYTGAWRVLQVANFGVPQLRRRLVLLAAKGFVPDFPMPTHARQSKGGLLPWRTLRDAIGVMDLPVTLADAVAKGGPQQFDWHVIRSLTPQNQLRLTLAKPGESWTHLPPEVRTACHRETRPGYFSNVYGRMVWDEPSVTITGGCTTPSKGRFGHPEAERTISVREAALIQTFPSDYVFDTPYMEYACNLIGNALPCDFAEAVAKSCAVSYASYRAGSISD